jgi:hypothetical protein
VTFFEQKIERMLRDIPFAATFPRFERIARDASGAFWVQLVASSTSHERIWEVYGATGGNRLRRIRVPHRANVVSAVVHADAIFATELNRDGLWRIAVYQSPTSRMHPP